MPALNMHSRLHVLPLPPRGSTVPVKILSLAEVLKYGFPSSHWSPEIRAWKRHNLPNLWRGLWRIVAARLLHVPHFYGQLCFVAIDPNAERIDYGLVSLRLITNVGATAVVTAFVSGGALNTFKFHGLGVGAALEAVTDTQLGNELSAYYAPVNTRATGTQVAMSTTVFQTIANVTLNVSTSVTEHGLFNQAATGGGTLLDRSLTSSTPVLGGGALQCDYRLTVSSV